MAAQTPNLLPSVGVQDLNFPVGMHGDEAANCSQAAPVGAEGHSLQTPIVIAVREQFLTRAGVPQRECIRIDGGDLPTVGTELSAIDLGGEFQSELISTGVHVPDLHFPNLFWSPTRRNGEARAVRAEGYTPYIAVVFQLQERLADLTL